MAVSRAQTATVTVKGPHTDQGARRLSRIQGVTIALADNGASPSNCEVYRTTDDGANWTLIGTVSRAARATIVSLPYNYFMMFWVDYTAGITPGIYAKKWLYTDISLPVTTTIYSGAVVSVSSPGGYQQICASVNSQGVIHLATHYKVGASAYDSMVYFRSGDHGDTWSAPVTVCDKGWSLLGTSIMVDHADTVHLCFSDHMELFGGPPAANARAYHMSSSDDGITWSSTTQMSSTEWFSNLCIFESKKDTLIVLGQKPSPSGGMVCSRSADSGATWGSLIQITTNSDGYADPSGAVDSDGYVYAACRNTGTGADGAMHNMVYRSIDDGLTWSRIFEYQPTDPPLDLMDGLDARVEPANSMRYQTWHNYGGPLEWSWGQSPNTTASIGPVYHSNDLSVSVLDISSNLIFSAGFEDWNPGTHQWFQSSPVFPATLPMRGAESTTWQSRTSYNWGVINGTGRKGSRYLHRTFNEASYNNIADPLLDAVHNPTGLTLTGLGGYLLFGGGYPSGYIGNTPSDITSGIITIRCRIRLTGSWAANYQYGDPGDKLTMLKLFYIWYSGGSEHFVLPAFGYIGGGTSIGTVYIEIDSETDRGVEVAAPELEDGQWHSLGCVVMTHYMGTNNVWAGLWIDDWNFAGDPLAVHSTSNPDFTDFGMIELFQNLGGDQHCALNMGIDTDDVEVWDGLPYGVSIAVSDPTPSAPTGLRIL